MAHRQSAAWVVLILAFVANRAIGQDDDVAQQIAGIWNVSISQTQAYYTERSLASDADEDFFKTVGALSVQFGADGSVVVRQADQEQMTGQWKLIKEEDAVAVIDLIREEEATRATIEFLEGGFIAIAPQNERPLVLVRDDEPALKGLTAELVGTWVCDRDATAALESNKTFSAEQLDDMMREASEMTVSFMAAGTFSAETGSGEEAKTLTGKWSANNVDETKRTLRLDLDAERGPESVEVEFRSGGSVLFAPIDEPSAVFVRKKVDSDKRP